MQIKEGKINDITDRKDRATAKLARMARNDCVFGGAKALVIADRLNNMNSEIDAQQIVSDVYTTCDGLTPAQYRPSICPECGQTQLGEDAALNCCYPDYD